MFEGVLHPVDSIIVIVVRHFWKRDGVVVNTATVT